MVGLPRVVVAAPASGHGKTTVATALLAAFTARGLVASPHKVGPDYIDPGYHGLAAGRPGRNLDPYLCGEHRVAPLFAHGARGADIAVVEGVMGLYDGAATPVDGVPGFGSTAHVARLLAAPVLLVVDATAQGRSVAALVRGFDGFEPGGHIAGVILNRVGSDRHEAILRDALAGLGVPVLGVLRRAAQVATPSRHLGLVPAAERSEEAREAVQQLAVLGTESLDLDSIYSIAAAAPALDVEAWDAAAEVGGPPVPGRPRVAVAGGAAFTFSYAETAELLAAAGAEVVTFDPLHATGLPVGTRGVVLGGGFPEVHADRLAANTPLRKEIADFAADGGVVAAECAGLLYLARCLDDVPMCGVLDAEARMTPRLTLGYREAVAGADSVLAAAGTRVRGHEFHRTALAPAAGPQPAWRIGAAGAEGWVQGGVHASYLHLHWAGSPGTARRFVEACA